jgi:hypothetical protein
MGCGVDAAVSDAGVARTTPAMGLRSRVPRPLVGGFALLCSTPLRVKLHVHVAVVIAFGGRLNPTPTPSG